MTDDENKKDEKKNYKFGLNLVEETFRHLEYLKRFENNPNLYHQNVVFEAIRRYEKCWLPLKNRYKRDLLQPPLDVYWVWHVHMLSGKEYVDDCDAMFNSLIDHWYVRDGEEEADAYEEARHLWTNMYREPFEIDLSRPSIDWDRFPKRPYESRIKYDIAEAVQRQKHFYYQVSLPHYNDEEFIFNAVDRYKRHIQLLDTEQDKSLLPSMDVALIWRTHILNPVVYEADMKNIFENLPTLTDSYFYDRIITENVELEVKTRQLWKEKFNEDYSVRGAGFRGPAPHATLSNEDYSQQLEARTNHFDAIITRMSINCLMHIKSICIKIELLPRNNFNQPVLLLKKQGKLSQGNYCDWSEHPPDGLKRFLIDTGNYDKIRIELSESKFIKKDEFIAYCETPLFDQDKLSPSRSQTVGKEATLFNNFGQPIAEVNLTIFTRPGTPGVAIFTVQPDDYSIREKSKASAWGPIALPKNPPTPDTYTGSCSYAAHTVVNHQDDVIFNVRAIHSVEAYMSVIQIMDMEDKFQAIAHVIGSNQVPLPDQLADPRSCVILDPTNNERAVLVKDALGDFAVIVGRWIVKPLSRQYDRGDDVVPTNDNPGFLELTIHQLRRNDKVRLAVPTRLPNGLFDFSFTVNGVEIDIKKGTVVVSEKARELAANLALGFACSLLFVLCRKKADYEPVENFNSRSREHSYDPYDNRGNMQEYYGEHSSRQGKRQGNRSVMQEDLLFAIAAGLNSELVPFKVNRDGGDQPGFGMNVQGFIPPKRTPMQNSEFGGMQRKTKNGFDMMGAAKMGGYIAGDMAANEGFGGMNEGFSGGKMMGKGFNPALGDMGDFGDDMEALDTGNPLKKGFSKIKKIFGGNQHENFGEFGEMPVEMGGNFAGRMGKAAMKNAMQGEDFGMPDDMGGMGKMAGKFGGKMGKAAMRNVMQGEDFGMPEDMGGMGKMAGKFGAKMGKAAMKNAMQGEDFGMPEDMGGMGKMAGKFGGKMGKAAMKNAMQGEDFGMPEDMGGMGKMAGKFGAKMGKAAMKNAMQGEDFGMPEDMGGMGKMAGKFGGKMGKAAMKNAMQGEDFGMPEDMGGIGKMAGKFGAKMGKGAMKNAMQGEDFGMPEDMGGIGKMAGKFGAKMGKGAMKNAMQGEDFGMPEDMGRMAGKMGNGRKQGKFNRMDSSGDDYDHEYSPPGGPRMDSEAANFAQRAADQYISTGDRQLRNMRGVKGESGMRNLGQIGDNRYADEMSPQSMDKQFGRMNDFGSDDYGMGSAEMPRKFGQKPKKGFFGKKKKGSKKQSSSEEEGFDPPGAPTGYGMGQYGDFRGQQGGNYNPYGGRQIPQGRQQQNYGDYGRY